MTYPIISELAEVLLMQHDWLINNEPDVLTD